MKKINKILCDLALCYTVFNLLLFVRPVQISVLLYFLVITALYFTVSFIFFKRTVFYSKQKLSKKSLIIIFSLVVFSWLVPIFWQAIKPKYDNIFYKRTDFNKLYTYKRPVSYPATYYYAKQINKYKQDPYEYVMQLFDKYDIVILAERMHPEYTQWDFFSNIILNDTFATKIKNVYTEFGCVNNQPILDSFLNTKFSTTEDLQKAAAAIVRENGGGWPLWVNRNIFDFIVNLHHFNENKDSLNKVNLYFSDMEVDWSKLHNRKDWDDNYYWTAGRRDSLMTKRIIDQYVKDSATNKKMLIIMNTLHAWNHYFSVTTASRIYRQFPNTTANVLINWTTQGTYNPMSSGVWDEAAKRVCDSTWAIDFSECPLGDIKFDLHFLCKNYKYKDIFTGMVYYLHPSKWKGSNYYPYMMDNFEDTLLRRAAVIGEDYLKMTKKRLDLGHYYLPTVEENNIMLLSSWIYLGYHTLVLLFLFVNLVVMLCRINKR